MRPFVPPTLHAPGSGADPLSQAEERGRMRGRQEGSAEGHARGLAEGAAAERAEWQPRVQVLEEELARVAAENAFTGTLREILAQRVADRQALDQAGREAIAGALRLIFPRLLDAAEGREVVGLLRGALQDRPTDQLRMRAHPDTLARMRDAMPADAHDRVQFTPDPVQPRGAAEIVWQNGGVRYDPQALLRDVTQALMPQSASSPVCEKPLAEEQAA